MLTKPLCLALFCLCAWAQSTDTAALDSQAAALKALVQQSRRLSMERTVFKIQAPGAGWEIGYPSSVAMDGKGAIYVLQRGEKADPVLVMDRQGRILRAWGKGMFKIPHSIRIDPQGNIWTVDSSSSTVMKFTATATPVFWSTRQKANACGSGAARVPVRGSFANPMESPSTMTASSMWPIG